MSRFESKSRNLLFLLRLNLGAMCASILFIDASYNRTILVWRHLHNRFDSRFEAWSFLPSTDTSWYFGDTVFTYLLAIIIYNMIAIIKAGRVGLAIGLTLLISIWAVMAVIIWASHTLNWSAFYHSSIPFFVLSVVGAVLLVRLLFLDLEQDDMDVLDG